MKRSIIYTGVLMLMVFWLSGCYRDVILPATAVELPPQFVSFSTDLQPIFTNNCALSGCHVAGSQVPYLTSDLAYQQLAGGYVNTVIPKNSILYQQINGNMGVHIPVASDRQKVYDWIRNGAPNN
jgi:hypothetical protein